MSKRAKATEKLKEKVEKEGLTDRVAALERGTEDCEFLSERIEDVLEVACHFYDERLKMLGEKEREKGRLDEKSEEKRRQGKREEKRYWKKENNSRSLSVV